MPRSIYLAGAAFWVAVLVYGSYKLLSKRAASGSGVAELEALAYLTHSPQRAANPLGGVTRKVDARIQPGHVLYASRTRPEAYLIDTSGRVVHTWRRPGSLRFSWEALTLLPGGDLLLLSKYEAALRLDRESRVKWRTEGKFHHDIRPIDGGYVAIGEEIIEREGKKIVFDTIVELDRGGVVTSIWSTHDHLTEMRRGFDTSLFLDSRASPEDLKRGVFYDYFHMNTVSAAAAVPGKEDFRAAPTLLTCYRHINQIAAQDPVSKEILWSWGEGKLDWPHYPTLLPGGNVLVYDNGRHRGFSRVIEIDPTSDKIVWEYRGTETEPFFSPEKGSAQRLENGNTLIADSENGRIIEVTSEGEIVWEFLNPSMRDGHRETIYRAVKVTPEQVQEILAPRKEEL